MKSTASAFATVLLGLVLLAPLGNSAANSAPDLQKMPPERFTTKVVQAITAQDGPAIFRAYVVTWKGQEVVASDALALTNYKVGDTITVLAMNHPFPQGKESHRLLGFTVVPTPAR